MPRSRFSKVEADRALETAPPGKAPTRPARKASSGAQQVRIIAGQWKRTPLTVVNAQGLRPTPDRVRETVFNWLGHLLGTHWESLTFLDLFAGSGALGFEAASRGAREVRMIETDAAAVANLEQVKQRLGASQVSIQRTDALSALARLPAAHFDCIFLDPPYDLALLPRLLPQCARLLKRDGLVYAESDQPLPDEPAAWLKGWQVLRGDKAGAVHYWLLHRIEVA